MDNGFAKEWELMCLRRPALRDESAVVQIGVPGLRSLLKQAYERGLAAGSAHSPSRDDKPAEKEDSNVLVRLVELVFGPGKKS